MTNMITYDDYLAHYGIKGMKWGRRRDPGPDGLVSTNDGRKLNRQEKKTARRTNAKKTGSNWNSNKKKNIGGLVAGTIVGGPIGLAGVSSYQIGRAQGLSKGKAVANAAIIGPVGNIAIQELQARKSTRED